MRASLSLNQFEQGIRDDRLDFFAHSVRGFEGRKMNVALPSLVHVLVKILAWIDASVHGRNRWRRSTSALRGRREGVKN
jgi:hypothetical protein